MPDPEKPPQTRDEEWAAAVHADEHGDWSEQYRRESDQTTPCQACGGRMALKDNPAVRRMQFRIVAVSIACELLAAGIAFILRRLGVDPTSLGTVVTDLMWVGIGVAILYPTFSRLIWVCSGCGASRPQS